MLKLNKGDIANYSSYTLGFINIGWQRAISTALRTASLGSEQLPIQGTATVHRVPRRTHDTVSLVPHTCGWRLKASDNVPSPQDRTSPIIAQLQKRKIPLWDWTLSLPLDDRVQVPKKLSLTARDNHYHVAQICQVLENSPICRIDLSTCLPNLWPQNRNRSSWQNFMLFRKRRYLQSPHTYES